MERASNIGIVQILLVSIHNSLMSFTQSNKTNDEILKKSPRNIEHYEQNIVSQRMKTKI